MSLGSNGLVRVRSLQKFKCDFMAQTCALIALVQPVLHRASCSNKTIQNASRHYETHQNISLGSNGVDSLRSLRKIPTWLHGTNFCNNALVHPVLHRVSCCYETILNASTHYETHQNMSLGSNGVDQVHSLQKLQTQVRGTIFWINWTISDHFELSLLP